MIGKAQKGSRASGILNYCYYEKEELSKKDLEKMSLDDVRGEIIYAQNVALDTLADGRFDMEYLAQQFKDCAAMNSRLKDYIWHQTFSFPEHEDPSQEQLEKLVMEFSKDFGFEENNLVVFKHMDKNHPHIHIVGNRINVKGVTTAKDSFSHLRTGDFCRKMELKLGLTIVPNMKALLPVEERKNAFSQSKLADSIRAKIDKRIPYVKTLEGLKKSLAQDGVKMYIGRGVSFLDKKTGASLKGSELGREYSLMNLEKRLAFENSLQAGSKTENSSLKVEPSTTKEEANPLPILDNTLTAAPNSPKRKLDEDDDEEELKRKRKRKPKL
ncbi:relaxase/mobilization nuclease domain-containing protein [Emticicia sp. W12TSBA100-4]|uniref:relaxase/mobilization nuclease domain-containing protein n=1 Tax=Emticicia sp. W12TSBA100-4 TaxID=3160965 RepID=UPI00330672A6